MVFMVTATRIEMFMSTLALTERSVLRLRMRRGSGFEVPLLWQGAP
jgi:hypothetical protein